MTHHRYAEIDGQRVFYREAGHPDAPKLVLLHGFPTSSHMFRELIPALADRYHVIAPDHIGFGLSSAPAVDGFDYTFDRLTEVTLALLDHLGIRRHALYIQDYGAPIGLKIASRHPERVSAIITQSGNAYTEGFTPFWEQLFAYATDPGPDTEPAVRALLTADATRWQYTHGVKDTSRISPDTWTHDQHLLDRPGNAEVQLALFRDYRNNLHAYPAFQQYFRDSQVPLLAVWGRHDEIFGPEGALAFRRDLPDAEIHLLDTGHFALEDSLDTVTGYIRGFLGRVVD
ncbi:pimeloyl-ACP methyl ester carboxylesterase [Saccharothrix tamanrassetensis]|uniref:Pimeloyl-ACP methyl ester carboxylesterase n=1 Tax=Saccharothrix tamanrassetensis TaxID=1051531 RepID=A0A841CTB3_9PSEU|nr:alpha/beta hydrolase [Saccharothrix tamanrassetensis]MBB5960103.1 pimeloyl-ACP methyl ester carboxylesterase [Saccharothrix tamanrassetensis]